MRRGVVAADLEDAAIGGVGVRGRAGAGGRRPVLRDRGAREDALRRLGGVDDGRDQAGPVGAAARRAGRARDEALGLVAIGRWRHF